MCKRMLKVVMLIAILSCFVGCGALITEDNPLGISDPNQALAFVGAGVSGGQTIQSIGAATGNPSLMAWGAGIAIISAAIGSYFIPKKGTKDGKS